MIPLGMAERAREDRYNDELERLLMEDEDAVGRSTARRPDNRVQASKPSHR